MKKVAILTNIIPTYREGFYNEIFKNDLFDVTVYCQEYSSKNIQVIHNLYLDNVVEICHSSILNNKLTWHYLPYLEIIRKYDIIIGDGNPRHISQAIFLSVARILGRKVAIWSTYESRRNVKLATRIRLIWWKIFKYILAYTEKDATSFINGGWDSQNVISVNNGIDQDAITKERQKWSLSKIEEWKLDKNISNRRILLSSGRAVKGRFDDIVYVIKSISKKDPSILWVLVGDGEGLDDLKIIISDNGLQNNVLLLGALYEERLIAPWFISADIFIYSGAIGLSLMHAFGYGLPVIIHDEFETHGPEASIFDNNVTGCSYRINDLEDMKSVILKLFSNRSSRLEMGLNALSLVESKYNSNIMSKQFEKFINIMK